MPNIEQAVEIYIKHCENGDNLHIVVDSDVDGYTSAAVIYQYTKLLFPKCKITYSLHSGKQHGLGDINVPTDTQLLIVPDAGTNDVAECELLRHDLPNLDIVILDHHNIEQENELAVVINNQVEQYPNHDLSGVGIAYKFIQAVDDELWECYADDFLDLVALGNIADMMDIRSFETKVLCDKGLSNIKNNLFKALILKQSESIHNNCSIRNVQFYITPLINALIRMGNDEEKELLFKAFIQQTEYFDYKPRGKSPTREDIYTRVARLCYNAKARQNKAIEKAMSCVDDCLKTQKLQDSVLFVNATGFLDNTLTGVMANKIANKYNHPCLVLRKAEDGLYSGSGRNCKNSYVENLNKALSETNKFELVQGHDNAFGVKIKTENIANTIEELNTVHPIISAIPKVDFVVDAEYIDIGVVKRFEDFKQYCGQGIDEPIIVIENLILHKSDFVLMGKNKNSWKCNTDVGVSYVKFNVNADTDKVINAFDDFGDDEQIIINAIGTCGLNYYKGTATPQFIIEEYEVVS